MTTFTTLCHKLINPLPQLIDIIFLSVSPLFKIKLLLFQQRQIFLQFTGLLLQFISCQRLPPLSQNLSLLFSFSLPALLASSILSCQVTLIVTAHVSQGLFLPLLLFLLLSFLFSFSSCSLLLFSPC